MDESGAQLGVSTKASSKNTPPAQASAVERKGENFRRKIQAADESSDNSDRLRGAGSSEPSASLEATEISSREISPLDSDDDDEDISLLEEYELGDRKPELRITDPEAYFKRLSDLEEQVKKHSCLSIHPRSYYASREDRIRILRDSKEAKDPNSTNDFSVWDSTEELWDRIEELSDLGDIVLSECVLECLEVIRRSCANVRRLGSTELLESQKSRRQSKNPSSHPSRNAPHQSTPDPPIY